MLIAARTDVEMSPFPSALYAGAVWRETCSRFTLA